MTVTINGTSGITLPSGSSAVGTTDSQTLTNKTIGSGYSGSTVTSGTAVASTSGTSIDFTGIPSWVKRITVMFNGVSTNGAGNPFYIQIGPTGGAETTGYIGGTGVITGSVSCTGYNYTSGFGIAVDNSASNTITGSLTITLIDASTNTWVCSGVFNASNRIYATYLSYSKALAGTLSRVRITSNGTDTFDAGSINILYE